MAHKKTDESYVYYIEVSPHLYTQLNALSLKSQMTIEQLSDMAVTLLIVATRNMIRFNPKLYKKKPLRQHDNGQPALASDIARDIIANPKKPRGRTKPQ